MPGSFYVGQHDNLDNRRAHVETTGPEIWKDTEGQVDVFVAPLGTGGTLCGVSEALKPAPGRHHPGVGGRSLPDVQGAGPEGGDSGWHLFGRQCLRGAPAGGPPVRAESRRILPSASVQEPVQRPRSDAIPHGAKTRTASGARR